MPGRLSARARSSTPSVVAVSSATLGGMRRRAATRSVSSSTSTSCVYGTPASDRVTRATGSKPSGTVNVAAPGVTAPIRSRRNVRISPRRWSWPVTYQRPEWKTSPYGSSSRCDCSPRQER